MSPQVNKDHQQGEQILGVVNTKFIMFWKGMVHHGVHGSDGPEWDNNHVGIFHCCTPSLSENYVARKVQQICLKGP